MRGIVLLAGLLGAMGVGIGAYGSHGLEDRLKSQGLSVEQISQRQSQCNVAVHYHMTHALALLSIGLLSGQRSKWRLAAASFFVLGITMFSGGLYSMVFLGKMGHWAIVPSGGLCFIIGWICTAGMAWDKA